MNSVAATPIVAGFQVSLCYSPAGAPGKLR
jgi:hypothetical protein